MTNVRNLRTVAPAINVTTRRVRLTVAPLAVHDAAPPIGDTVTTPAAASDIARAVIGSEISECVLAIFLDARNRVTGYSEVARGTLNASRLAPRDVLIAALHANAAAVIVAHNHPSAIVTPSHADRTATMSLRQAARLIGLPLADHLIVTPDTVFSFRQDERWSDMAGGHTTDCEALDAIASMLRDPEWGVGMLEDIGEIVIGTGRSIDNLPGDEPTWDRH